MFLNSALGLFLSARRYTSAVYAVPLDPSVCPSQAGIVSKRLEVRAYNQLLDAKDLGEIPNEGDKCKWSK